MKKNHVVCGILMLGFIVLFSFQKLSAQNKSKRTSGIAMSEGLSEDSQKLQVAVLKIGLQDNMKKIHEPVIIRFENGKQKKWLPANFRLVIDGLEDASKKIIRMDSMTIIAKKQLHQVSGVDLDGDEMIARIIIGEKVLMNLSGNDLSGFRTWYQESAKANKGDKQKSKKCSLEFFNKNGTPIGKLQFGEIIILDAGKEKAGTCFPADSFFDIFLE